jgi:hypothetical protein
MAAEKACPGRRAMGAPVKVQGPDRRRCDEADIWQ